MQQLLKQLSPLNLRPALRTLLSTAPKVSKLFLLKYKMVPRLAGRMQTDVVPDMFAATVLQERNSTRDSAMRNARKATLALSLSAIKDALRTIKTEAPSAISPIGRMSAQMTCEISVCPAASVHMEEEPELSQNATLVTMQKASAIQNATMATPEKDQSAGSSARTGNTNVVPCARPTERNVVTWSLKSSGKPWRQSSNAPLSQTL